MNAKESRGQAAVLTILFLTVLLGATAMAIDVGSWFHAKRQLQAEADAAALAGAQALPDSTGDAQSLALQYSAKNGGDLTPSGISFSSETTPNDTINVHLTAPAPGFFSKLFGINTVTVSADASARSDNINAALGVAPIAVNWKHPMLQCSPLPCSDPTEIDLADQKQPGGPNAAGAFTLLDLIQSDNGNAGASEVASWVTNGFDEYMPLGGYDSVPSSEFNNIQMKNAMQASIGQVLLFPIYNSITGSGSNAVYNIIGWAGFHVTGFDPSGNSGKVYGWFTRRISEGIQVTSSQNIPDYGARAVQLVN
jgi:hypothetical protein